MFTLPEPKFNVVTRSPSDSRHLLDPIWARGIQQKRNGKVKKNAGDEDGESISGSVGNDNVCVCVVR